MPILILCSQDSKKTPAIRKAERVLRSALSRKRHISKIDIVQTFRLKALPGFSDKAGIQQLARELLQISGMENAPFQTEFVEQDGFSFLVIYSEALAHPASQPDTARKRTTWKTIPKVWKISVAAIGGVLVLFALYNGYGRNLVGQIDTQYKLGKCAEVVRLSELGENIYLPIIMPWLSPAFEHYGECQKYESAAEAQQEGDWANAYATYQDYLSQYPESVLSPTARENVADVLLNWSEEECETQQYSEAINRLSVLLEEYSASPVSAVAKKRLPRCYFEWGKTLVDAQDYSTALEKYNLAIEKDVDPEDPSGPANQAQAEIPDLFYKWAGFLTVHGEFEAALEKYNLAIEADLDPGDPSGPASLAKADIPILYRQWAESLASEGNFEEAMVQYEIYISMVSPKDKTLAHEAMAAGYRRWAEELCNDADFWSALEKLDLAEAMTVGEEANAALEQARIDTYAAFAASSGSQARQFMDEAAKNLVEEKQIPALPIFGTDNENVRIYVYGEGKNVSDLQRRISEELLPQTPGEMRYVAFVSEDNDVAGKCGGTYLETSGFSVRVVPYTYVLYTPHWIVNLIDINTGISIEQKGFFGNSPHCAAKSRSDLFGDQPKLADLEAWLRTYVK